MRKLKVTILIAILFHLSGCAQNKSELLNCWIESYQPDFEFVSQLDKLEKSLLKSKQIKGTTGKDYKELFEAMNSGEITLIFDSISVEQFVSEKPFKDCGVNSNLPNEDDLTIKYGLLFSIYVVLASDYVTIPVELTKDSELLFNHEKTEFSNFTKLASESINALEKKGISRDEIIFSLKVSENVKMSLVSNIQMQLRELNVRKVNYGN